MTEYTSLDYMLVFPLEMNGQADMEVDYKRKYKNLKRKLKFLVYVSTPRYESTPFHHLRCSDKTLLANMVFIVIVPGARVFSRGA